MRTKYRGMISCELLLNPASTALHRCLRRWEFLCFDVWNLCGAAGPVGRQDPFASFVATSVVIIHVVGICARGRVGGSSRGAEVSGRSGSLVCGRGTMSNPKAGMKFPPLAMKFVYFESQPWLCRCFGRSVKTNGRRAVKRIGCGCADGWIESTFIFVIKRTEVEDEIPSRPLLRSYTANITF